MCCMWIHFVYAQVEKKYWWLNFKCWCYIGLAVTLVVGVAVVVILALTHNL